MTVDLRIAAPERVLIAVTHLLGVGHFARMAALGRALAAEGSAVRLVTGGRSVPTISTRDLDVVQLPAVHCRDADFSVLYNDAGARIESTLLNERAKIMRSTVHEWQPDLMIAELYPFGRRILAPEFEALVEAAFALPRRPALLASVRDVLNPPKSAARAKQVLNMLAGRFDAVLVHGDDKFVPLDVSWPIDPVLARRLFYAGYLRDVSRSADPLPQDQREGILVSAGGSTAGRILNHLACAAAHFVTTQNWHLLVAQSIPDEDFAALQAAAPAHMLVERARPDFPALLARAVLSISQAGYNTVLDLIAAETRAILVPFAEGGEREQTLRARALGDRGIATVLEQEWLTVDALVAATRQALASPAPDLGAIEIDGAERAVQASSILTSRAKARHEAWLMLGQSLEEAARRGRGHIPLWVRDDDAVEVSSELDHFLEILARHHAPVALAVIPGCLDPSLVQRVSAERTIDILVHGWTHKNHAAPLDRAAEFGGARSWAMMKPELVDGLDRTLTSFGEQALPVFVPPWNRIDAFAAAQLPTIGYRGLSTFAQWCPPDAPSELTIINADWDPIDWRGTRGIRDEATLLKALSDLVRKRNAEPFPAPIGLLTHHLVHDGWINHFLNDLLGLLARSPAIHFESARNLFRPARQESASF